jgi:NAD(P)-dependent dehydrogenase (short-subunit alcohol dehydrogenase family)
VQHGRDLDRLFEKVREEKGNLGILVANSGFIDPQALADTIEDNFDKTFSINVRGLLFTVQKHSLSLAMAGLSCSSLPSPLSKESRTTLPTAQ